jgi:nucleoid-associated protein YgaU
MNPTPAVPFPPAAGQPRVDSVPPPLDPNDYRLGGYREAPVSPGGTMHRTASRPHGAAPGGHLDPQSEPLVANGGEYIVRPNDNFWRISRKVYGTARYFQALAKHNEATIPDTRHMKPGIKISTPPKEMLEQQYGNLVPAMAAPSPVGAIMHSPAAPKKSGLYVETDGQPAYRIGPTDTLSGISKKTLGRSTRWEEIYDLNRERLQGPDALAVGSILRLPPDASQTRVVGKPVEHH